MHKSYTRHARSHYYGCLGRHGVRILPVGSQRARAVTCPDVSLAEVEEVAAVLRKP